MITKIGIHIYDKAAMQVSMKPIAPAPSPSAPRVTLVDPFILVSI